MTDTVSPGKYVEYSYLLTDAATGRKLFEATKSRPDQMIYGVSQDVVPGLASVMEGLKAGDKFEVTLPPAAAFGERNEVAGAAHDDGRGLPCRWHGSGHRV